MAVIISRRRFLKLSSLVPAGAFNLRPFTDCINQAIDYLQNSSPNNLQAGTVSSGFGDLDRIIGGFRPGELTHISGLPKIGTTSFCLGIAMHAAIEQRVPVAYFSLDNAAEQTALRMLRIYSGNTYSNSEPVELCWNPLRASAKDMKGPGIYFDDSPGISSDSLLKKARGFHEKHGFGMLIVDTVECVVNSTGIEKKPSQLSCCNTVRLLKIFAAETKMSVIALDRLYATSSLPPTLMDLCDNYGNTPASYADKVLFVQRDCMPYDEETGEIVIARNGRGPCGEVCLRFNREIGRFEDYKIK